MYNDCVLSEDGLAEGYIVLFDMKGVSLGHLARVSLPSLRAFMIYIQEAHPARLKSIHVLNTANFINHIMRLVTPMIKSEILNIVHFHSGMLICVVCLEPFNLIYRDNLFSNLIAGIHPENIPIEILPKEYGGEACSIKDLDEETKRLSAKYIQWLRDTESFKVDDSKRPKKQSWWSYLTGSSTSPAPSMTIEQQKEEFLKNLQID
ncbi:alpha-tocopherol transfer protein-related [Holotrichia oblita]|uniref:Alpha-tocopherol transfer protein-related n=1 Tax=Holotrichia oblita TaxID=644536 RepID=A0ACB9SI08_HOLOL|nr:alpha-tocopherol transfer protein-related [Holotrichia oblita]